MKTIDFNDLGELILNESFREYVEGNNPESTEVWNQWILKNPDKKSEFDTAVRVLKTMLKARKTGIATDKNESLRRLLKRIDEEQAESSDTSRSFRSMWIKIAAVGLLIVGLYSLWNLFHVRYIKSRALAYNEIIVPLGEKAQVILSDGTHVWINSDSKLRYPVKFGEISRNVTLEGEAYFDVTKKQGKTFVVNTRDAKVNVLGTAFNVKCYPGDEKTQTIVVRGVVRVQDIHGNHRAFIVKPNEMATVNVISQPGQAVSKTNSVLVHKVNPESLVSWKDQMLVFAGESFEDLTIKMERWFNVKIKIDDEDLKSERYNGKFVHNETVYQVLEAIKLTTPISFKVEKDTIIISRR